MSNPFFEPSTLPYQLPPFADIRDEHYAEALEAGFQQQRDEIEAIVNNDAAPTIENTLEALEGSGAILERVMHVFWSITSTDSSEFLQQLEEEYAPKVAAHFDSIQLHSKLYERISALFENPSPHWSNEQQYLVERYHKEMTLAGAGLDRQRTERLKELNQRLASLSTLFDKNLQADTNDLAVVIDDVSELEGLAQSEIEAAEAAAQARGLSDKYLITLPLFTGHPWLASLENRDVRERIMRASLERASRGNDNDNSEIVLEITKLRAERASLLGFVSHTAYVTADETAGTPAAVADMLGRLAPAAARNAHAEAETLREEIASTPAPHALESWDWAFYTEKVRSRLHNVDTAALRPYFEAERVLHDGVFFAAGLVYGLRFEERTDLTGYHSDNRFFEAFEEDGTPLGLFLLDLYTRDSKRGGAWMNPLISQNALLDQPTIVMNNLNVPKPPPGKPTLLTFDETATLFHEFGHALHGLLAKVTYPKFSGTNVFRDFVEFPSQVNEMWMLWPEVVNNYAKHFETGESIPSDVLERIQAMESFNQGHDTSEYLAAALLDQAWHNLAVGEKVTDVESFEREALEKAGLLNSTVPTRYSSTYFQHVFSGGYSAGYYSYIWSEVMDADTVEYFKESGNVREVGDSFRQHLLGIGGSKDPRTAYREFRGRDAEIEPLLDRRGLAA